MIINGTGNSRFLKSIADFLSVYPTYADFAQALVDGTFPFDFNGINPEGVSQNGTQLSQGTLMTDATEAAIWGTANDRTINQALLAMAGDLYAMRLVQKYTAAGSYNWTVPLSGKYIACIIGGGGGGSSASMNSTFQVGYLGKGGASGYAMIWVGDLTAGSIIPVVVGAGGSGGSGTQSTNRGNKGGTSSFNGKTALGGDGGATSSYDNAAYGGQSTDSQNTTGPLYVYYGGLPVERSPGQSQPRMISGTPIFSIFRDENGLPVSMLAAGPYSGEASAGSIPAFVLPNGKTSSAGKWATSTSAVSAPATGTDVGCGGGGCTNKSTNSTSQTVKGGNGAPGGVFIYRIGGAA